MISIPSFYRVEMDFNDARETITRQSLNGDLLAGMEGFQNRWNHHCKQDIITDDEFFECWGYEANAYNVIWEGFSKLFA